MATHYVRHTSARRVIDRGVDWVTWLLTVWIEFWRRTEPADPAHEAGATEEFAADLHDINTAIAELHEQPSGRYALLLDAAVISGDPDLTDVIPRIDLDGWSLCGSLTDQLPGA